MHIRTFSGRLVDPFRLVPEDVQPYSMLHALCLINRFTGHSVFPYSVGQHTLNLVSYFERIHASRSAIRAALVHDMSEAWFNDLASPIKAELPEYREYTEQAQLYVCRALGVTLKHMASIDYADKRIYVNERDALTHYNPAVHGTGMGDNLIALRGPMPYLREMYWRDVRAVLWMKFEEYFPEWGGTA